MIVNTRTLSNVEYSQPNEEDSQGGLEFCSPGESRTPSFQSMSQRSAVGPKAVLADYNEAKYRMVNFSYYTCVPLLTVLQYIKHEQQQAELERMAHKNSFTVLSNREEEILAEKEQKVNENLEELLDDENEFFKQYREKRMQQWRQQQM